MDVNPTKSQCGVSANHPDGRPCYERPRRVGRPRSLPRYEALLPGVVVLLSIQFQPGLWGYNWANVLSCVVLVACVFMWLMYRRVGSPIGWGALLMFPIYAGLVGLSTGDEDAWKGVVLAALSSALLCTMSECFPVRRLQLAYVGVMCVVGVLTLVTYAVRFSAILGRSPDVFLPVKHYFADSLFFFPFAVIYNQYYSTGLISLSLPRSMGIFCEPGVNQAFMASACLLALNVTAGMRRVMTVSVLLLNTVLCNSTAGFVSAFVVIALSPLFFHGKRRWITYSIYAFSFFLVVAGVLWFIDADAVGLRSKLTGVSGQDRVQALVDFESHFAGAFLFGTAVTETVDVIASRTGSLPLFILRTGILGFMLSLLPYVYIVARTRRFQWRSAMAFLPIFITALTSQPLWATGPCLAAAFVCLSGSGREENGENYNTGKVRGRRPGARNYIKRVEMLVGPGFHVK